LVSGFEFDRGFTVGLAGMAKNEPFWFTVN
jgi:hypothetical protein